MSQLFRVIVGLSLFVIPSLAQSQTHADDMAEACPNTYSRSDCSQVPGIVLSSWTNPEGIVEIHCQGQFAITSCSANGDPSSSSYRHWQGLARCVPFSSYQTNCSASRVGDYDVSAPVIKLSCPPDFHAVLRMAQDS